MPASPTPKAAKHVLDQRYRIVREPHPGQYVVTSESKEGTIYDVDVLAHNTEGHCTCADWANRIGPCIERGEKPARRFCKHVALAREDMLDYMHAAYLAQVTGSTPPPWYVPG